MLHPHFLDISMDPRILCLNVRMNLHEDAEQLWPRVAKAMEGGGGPDFTEPKKDFFLENSKLGERLNPQSRRVYV